MKKNEDKEPKKTFTYRGYEGSTEISFEDKCLYGVVLGIKDLVLFEGNTVQELEDDFHYMLDLYLEDQENKGN